MSTDISSVAENETPFADILKARSFRLSARQMREVLLSAFERMDSIQQAAVLDHVLEFATPRGRRTKAEVTTAIVQALFRAGYDHGAIARITDLPEKRVRSITGMSAARIGRGDRQA